MDDKAKQERIENIENRRYTVWMYDIEEHGNNQEEHNKFVQQQVGNLVNNRYLNFGEYKIVKNCLQRYFSIPNGFDEQYYDDLISDFNEAQKRYWEKRENGYKWLEEYEDTVNKARYIVQKYREDHPILVTDISFSLLLEITNDGRGDIERITHDDYRICERLKLCAKVKRFHRLLVENGIM